MQTAAEFRGSINARSSDSPPPVVCFVCCLLTVLYPVGMGGGSDRGCREQAL